VHEELRAIHVLSEILLEFSQEILGSRLTIISPPHSKRWHLGGSSSRSAVAYFNSCVAQHGSTAWSWGFRLSLQLLQPDKKRFPATIITTIRSNHNYHPNKNFELVYITIFNHSFPSGIADLRYPSSFYVLADQLTSVCVCIYDVISINI
jgi:hypothetical protein